jgi:hypothetical protein
MVKRRNTPGDHWVGCFVRPRPGLDTTVKRYISTPSHGSPAVQHVVELLEWLSHARCILRQKGTSILPSCTTLGARTEEAKANIYVWRWHWMEINGQPHASAVSSMSKSTCYPSHTRWSSVWKWKSRWWMREVIWITEDNIVISSSPCKFVIMTYPLAF